MCKNARKLIYINTKTFFFLACTNVILKININCYSEINLKYQQIYSHFLCNKFVLQ